MLSAAERTGALLVSLENVYGYGPTGGSPMIEDLPLTATTLKGRTRAAMTGELLAAADARQPRSVTTRAILELVAGDVGHPVEVRSMPKLAARMLGLVNPMMRALSEMAYEFEEPFVLDTTKYESTFAPAGTPLADAISETVAWYRSRTDAP